MTTLMERATAATADRGGRDLLSYRATLDLATLAKSGKTTASGGLVVDDVRVLKAGAFHGGAVVLDDQDLAAMVARFATLAGIGFQPPVRLDHGWSVKDVSGYVTGLRVEDLDDPSDGGRAKPTLLAQIELVDAWTIDAIRTGKLRNVSSEVGPYETNNGDLYSLIYWGFAFVDVPAVEGLGSITLSKLGKPRHLTNLTTGAPVPDLPDDVLDPESSAPGSADAPTTTEAPADAVQDLDADDADAQGDDDAATEDDAQGGVAAAAAADTAPEDAAPAAGGAPATVDLAAIRATPGLTPSAALRQLGFTEQADALDRDHAAAVELRVTTYAKAGKLGAAAITHARALLSSTDPQVVEHTTQLLELSVAPVQTGVAPGTQDSVTVDTPRTGTQATPEDLLAAETREEFGRVWSSLSTEQRADTAFLAAYSERRASLAAS